MELESRHAQPKGQRIKGKNENITELNTTLKDLKINKTENIVSKMDGIKELHRRKE